MSKTIKNRKAKDRQRRKKLKDRLRARGVSEATIEAIIAEQRDADREARHQRSLDQPSREEILANTDDSLWPDDTGYKPTKGDPLLQGAGRADGMTAKVVRRRNTITKYQYDQATKP